MIKVGYGSEQVIVHMSRAEFNFLAGETYGNVPDGTDISLTNIKNKMDLIDAKEAELLELKDAATIMVQKLDAIGI